MLVAGRALIVDRGCTCLSRADATKQTDISWQKIMEAQQSFENISIIVAIGLQSPEDIPDEFRDAGWESTSTVAEKSIATCLVKTLASMMMMMMAFVLWKPSRMKLTVLGICGALLLYRNSPG